MWRSRRRREFAVPPSMAPASPTSAESGNPKPGRSPSQDTAREGDRRASADPLDRLDPILTLLAGGADPDPPPRRWPKFALFAACLAVLAAGWWFYRNDAGDRREGTLPPVLTVPAKPKQAMKPAELDGAQQAELPSRTYEELLAKERSTSAGLEQKLATREKDGQLLVLERARTKELEEQLSARKNDQQLLAAERQRSKELEEQLATRQNDQPSLAEARARVKELEQQLAARQNDQQSLEQARARIKELEQQVAARQQPAPVRQPTTSPAAANDFAQRGAGLPAAGRNDKAAAHRAAHWPEAAARDRSADAAAELAGERPHLQSGGLLASDRHPHLEHIARARRPGRVLLRERRTAGRRCRVRADVGCAGRADPS